MPDDANQIRRELRADHDREEDEAKCDGDDLSGCIVAETPTGITMRRAGGLEDTILRKNIKSLRSTGLSLMPEGMESGINHQQMADLLAYLQSYKD